MSEYKSRKITGWRSVLIETAAEVRERFWNAPSHIVYIAGLEAPKGDQLAGHVRWYRRIFGPERAAASEELRKLRLLKQLVRRKERTFEELEKIRIWCRQWRAKQTDDWRRDQARKKRLLRLAKPEIYGAISKRAEEKRRGTRSNSMRRVRRLENLATHQAKARAYYHANRERICEKERARYAARGATKPQ